MKSQLDGFAGLRELVANRNFAKEFPTGTPYPLTTFEVINERKFPAMQTTPAITESRFRVNSFAEKFTTARLVDRQVRNALSRFRGSTGVVVQDVLEDTMNDSEHPEVKNGIHQRVRDFRVFYEEI